MCTVPSRIRRHQGGGSPFPCGVWYHARMSTRMTPRERVLAALRHAQPDRVPFAWGFGATPDMAAILARELSARGIDWAALRCAVDDIARLPSPPPLAPPPDGRDMWGIAWAPMRYQGGAYTEVARHPLAGVTTVEALRAYPWPDPAAFDYDGLAARPAERAPRRARATLIAGGNPFEIYCWMTGLEEAIINLLDAPEVVTCALERITGVFETMLTRTLAVIGDQVDMIFFADDLGSQTGPLISRALYRELLMPFHRRLTTRAAELAPHAARMLHSDGAVFDLLPDIIDAGFTVFEAVQTDAAGMDPARLKAVYGSALAFHGGISVQQLLPHAAADAVYAESRRLVETFGAGGGYIAAPSHAIQVGTPVDNVLAMLRGVLGEDDFAAACAAARTAH